MRDRIEQAAQVIQRARDAGPVYDEAGEPYSAAETIARALDEAGLLAPDKREEWGTRFDGDYVHPGMNAAYPFWFKGDPPNGVNVHRYVSDWEQVEP